MCTNAWAKLVRGTSLARSPTLHNYVLPRFYVRRHARDFAYQATYVEMNGEPGDETMLNQS